jgi:gamma-glutamylcyclotransferase (GGCT)/AIG2-like uncharacterized protein YtfP
MPGLLYDLGDYPGAIYLLDVKALVYGSIYKLNKAPGALLATLDAYEGVSVPFRSTDEYKRESAPITVNGQTIDCWVYLYNQAIINQSRIESGDYVQYVSQ